MAWKITVGLVLIVAAFGAGYYTSHLESRRYIESVDQRFDDARKRAFELERINDGLSLTITDLADRIERAQSIVVQLSESSGTALEKVKRVIENLRRLQEILHL